MNRETNDAAPFGSRQVARLVCAALLERKGEDLVVLGMESVLPITDYFVICTGRSARHVDSLREAVEMRLKEDGLLRLHRAGRETNSWVLLDYGGVVVHIFQPEFRDYYDLELLWTDATPVPLEDLEVPGVRPLPSTSEGRSASPPPASRARRPPRRG